MKVANVSNKHKVIKKSKLLANLCSGNMHRSQPLTAVESAETLKDELLKSVELKHQKLLLELQSN